MDYSILELTMLSYLAVGMAKAILVLADAHVAAGTLARLTGLTFSGCLARVVPLTLALALFAWPRLLREEGVRFFLAYTRFQVIRTIVRSYRDARIAEEQAHR